MIDKRYKKPYFCNQCGKNFSLLGTWIHLLKLWCVFEKEGVK